MDTELTMMDETEQNQTTGTATPLSQLGLRLKKTREAAQLSEKDVALRLHLNITFIDMMESGKFDEKLPSTFLRGYLRSYARLLHIPEDEINEALEQITQPATAPLATNVIKKPVLMSSSPKNTDRYIRSITYIVPLVLIVLVGTWWNSHSRYTVSDVAPETADIAPMDNTPVPAPAPASTDDNPLSAMTPVDQTPVLDPSMVPTDTSSTVTNTDSPITTTAPQESTAAPSAITDQPATSEQQTDAVTDTTSDQPQPDAPVKQKTHSSAHKMQMEHSEPGLEDWGND